MLIINVTLGSLSLYIHSGISLIQILNIVLKIFFNILISTSHSPGCECFQMQISSSLLLPPPGPQLGAEHPGIALITALRSRITNQKWRQTSLKPQEGGQSSDTSGLPKSWQVGNSPVFAFGKEIISWPLFSTRLRIVCTQNRLSPTFPDSEDLRILTLKHLFLRHSFSKVKSVRMDLEVHVLTEVSRTNNVRRCFPPPPPFLHT